MPVWQWEPGSGELWVEALPGSAHMRHCICRCVRWGEKEARKPGLISPSSPHAPAKGWNKQIYSHSSLPLPESPWVLTCYPWVEITIFIFFFVPFAQRHSITPEADSCLRGEAGPLPRQRSAPLSLCAHHFIRQDSTFNPIVIQLRYSNSTPSLINAA